MSGLTCSCLITRLSLYRISSSPNIPCAGQVGQLLFYLLDGYLYAWYMSGLVCKRMLRNLFAWSVKSGSIRRVYNVMNSFVSLIFALPSFPYAAEGHLPLNRADTKAPASLELIETKGIESQSCKNCSKVVIEDDVRCLGSRNRGLNIATCVGAARQTSLQRHRRREENFSKTHPNKKVIKQNNTPAKGWSRQGSNLESLDS